jgi:hypothetical protein
MLVTAIGVNQVQAVVMKQVIDDILFQARAEETR